MGTEVQACNSNDKTIFIANAKYNVDGSVYTESACSNNFDEARRLAKDKLEVNVSIFTQRNTPSRMDISSGANKLPKEKFNGGGSKQVSEPQKQFIINLCDKLGIDVYAHCRNKFGKDLDNLQG